MHSLILKNVMTNFGIKTNNSKKTMDKVYILQESATRDGLNFDCFAKSESALKAITLNAFKERFEDEEISIKEIIIENGNISVHYILDGHNRIWNNYSYIEVPVI